MGKFDMSPNEMFLFDSFFEEGAYFLGRSAKLYQVDLASHQPLGDTCYTYLSPVDINMYFAENPNVKTLESIGWFSEDDEELPHIGYLPKHDVNGVNIKVTVGARIELPYTLLAGGTQLFEVTAVKIQTTPMWYTVKLVPVRQKVPPQTEIPKLNNKWLKRG